RRMPVGDERHQLWCIVPQDVGGFPELLLADDLPIDTSSPGPPEPRTANGGIECAEPAWRVIRRKCEFILDWVGTWIAIGIRSRGHEHRRARQGVLGQAIYHRSDCAAGPG